MTIGKIQLLGILLTIHATVAGLFADMLNMAHKGSGFTWKNFPDLAVNYAISQVFLNGPQPKKEYSDKQRAQITDFVTSVANKLAIQLLERANLFEKKEKEPKS